MWNGEGVRFLFMALSANDFFDKPSIPLHQLYLPINYAQIGGGDKSEIAKCRSVERVTLQLKPIVATMIFKDPVLILLLFSV